MARLVSTVFLHIKINTCIDKKKKCHCSSVPAHMLKTSFILLQYCITVWHRFSIS